MVHILIVLIGMGGAALCAAEMTPLAPQSEAVLEQRKGEIDAGAAALRYNWVAPLNLSLTYSEQKNASSDELSGVAQATASISQDIFRSGGIVYAIRYADDKHAYDALSLLQERDALFEKIFAAVLQIRKLVLQCEQSEYLQKNHEITLFLKRQQYEAGEIDITLLNDAIMAKNGEAKHYLQLRQSQADWRLQLRAYSDVGAEAIRLPEFVVLKRDTYLEQNYALALASAQEKIAFDGYRVTQSGFLPSLSLNARAGYTDYLHGPLSLTAAEGGSYSFGVTLSMPLQYNGDESVEEQRALMLRRKAEREETRRYEESAFERSLNLIERYRGENALLKENLELYRSLIDVTQKGFDTGYKTGYDLQTLQNTQRSDELEMAINAINIQLELLKLHMAVKQSKERR